MAARLLLVAAAAVGALAFKNTAPVVAWSSSSSHSLDTLPSRLAGGVHSGSLLESIFDSDDVCKHDAIVIIEHPGLHSSDLSALTPFAPLARTLSEAPSMRQYAYVPHLPSLDLPKLAEAISAKCRSCLHRYTPSERTGGTTVKPGEKHVVCIKMPHLDHSGKERKQKMAEHESMLSSELSSLASIFPDHLVVYSGVPIAPPSPFIFLKRQADDSADRPILDLSSQDLSAPSSFATADNSTLAKGGVLKKYQLLTPGLITALLVVFFILLPVIYVGLSALASIQNPLRVDVSKSFNAQERKNHVVLDLFYYRLLHPPSTTLSYSGLDLEAMVMTSDTLSKRRKAQPRSQSVPPILKTSPDILRLIITRLASSEDERNPRFLDTLRLLRIACRDWRMAIRIFDDLWGRFLDVTKGTPSWKVSHLAQSAPLHILTGWQLKSTDTSSCEFVKMLLATKSSSIRVIAFDLVEVAGIKGSWGYLIHRPFPNMRYFDVVTLDECDDKMKLRPFSFVDKQAPDLEHFTVRGCFLAPLLNIEVFSNLRTLDVGDSY
ncbi:hypothetical protein NLJ89_g7372 [Agrocybe chaxingu]|uniref:Protein BIG1 n=1 Tax=Agrocybe chaxingu TaxID=84603 RepID=A0A9W8MVI3_9AGAR|nr:hypothetical protein NLJ89_g7372 [Agrocybe chaxingu]